MATRAHRSTSSASSSSSFASSTSFTSTSFHLRLSRSPDSSVSFDAANAGILHSYFFYDVYTHHTVPLYTDSPRFPRFGLTDTGDTKNIDHPRDVRPDERSMKSLVIRRVTINEDDSLKLLRHTRVCQTFGLTAFVKISNIEMFIKNN